MEKFSKPKAIIGLGNPGHSFVYTRHNIGFRILDALAESNNGNWQGKDNFEISKVFINQNPVILIKPQTFMNNSGAVLPYLLKQGIKAEDILVVHDELELPFGKLAIKSGGSHKGHNGLKSIISAIGSDFERLRFGIGRPERREDVPDYVLHKFSEPEDKIQNFINQSVNIIEGLFT